MVTKEEAQASQAKAFEKEKAAQASGETSGGSPVGQISGTKNYQVNLSESLSLSDTTTTSGGTPSSGGSSGPTPEQLREQERITAEREAQAYELNPNRSASASAADQEKFNRALRESIKKTGGNIGDYFLRPQEETTEEEPTVKYDDPYFAYKYQESKGLTPFGESIAKLKLLLLQEQAKPTTFLEEVTQQPPEALNPLAYPTRKIGGAIVPESLLSGTAYYGPETQQQTKRIDQRELTTGNLKDYIFKDNKDAARFLISFEGGESKTIPKEKAYHDVLGLIKEGKGFTISPGFDYKVNLFENFGGGAKEGEYLTTKNLKEFLFEKNQDAKAFQIVKGAEGQKAEIINIPKDESYFKVLNLLGKGEAFTITPVFEGGRKNETETMKMFGLVPPEKKGTKAEQTLEKSIQDVQKFREENKGNILGLGAGVIEGVLGLGAFTRNIMKSADANFEKMMTGKSTPSYTFTIPYGPAQYPIETVVSGIMTGDIVSSEAKARQELMKHIEEEGLYPIIGKAAFEVLPFVGVGRKALPISSPTFKAITESGKVTTVARTVEVGFGSKTKQLLTLINNKPYLGSPYQYLGKSALKEIEAVDRGLEFSTQGKLGTKILTSEEGLKVLYEAGKALPRDVEAARLHKELAGIIKFSSENVPQALRKKAATIPKEPLFTVKPGAESEALVTEVIPGLSTMKGTLAETVQLEKDLLGVKSGLRTTGDIDVDYQGFFGQIKAHRVAKRAKEILSKVAEEGRTFEKSGTNVKVREKGKSETVLNILTKKDEKTGYLNKGDLKPFGIELKENIVKVPIKEGSKKVGKFVSIEQQGINRIESSFALQGPKSDKFRGKGPIPYLKEGAEILTTEKGYTILPTEHRLKDLSKLVSQDVEQIARNLKQAGYEKQAVRATEIKENLKALYPEIDFSIKAERMTIEQAARSPSKFYSAGRESALPSSALALETLAIIEQRPLTRQERRALRQESRASRFAPKSATKSAYGRLASKPASYRSASKSSASVLDSLSSAKKSSLSKLESSIKSSSAKESVSSPSRGSPLRSFSALIGSSSGKSGSPSKGSPSRGSPGGSPFGGSPGGGPSGGVPSGSPSRGGPSGVPGLVPPPKKLPVVIPFWKTRVDKEKPSPKKPRADFLGNTRESEIEGIYSRSEVTYGISKINKLLSKEYSNLRGSGEKKGKSKKKFAGLL